MSIAPIHHFEELEARLRSWRNWGGEGDYDYIGMARILGACVDNLREFSRPSDWEEMAEVLSEEQREFLRKFLSFIEGLPRS